VPGIEYDLEPYKVASRKELDAVCFLRRATDINQYLLCKQLDLAYTELTQPTTHTLTSWDPVFGTRLRASVAEIKTLFQDLQIPPTGSSGGSWQKSWRGVDRVVHGKRNQGLMCRGRWATVWNGTLVGDQLSRLLERDKVTRAGKIKRRCLARCDGTVASLPEDTPDTWQERNLQRRCLCVLHDAKSETRAPRRRKSTSDHNSAKPQLARIGTPTKARHQPVLLIS
jgi:hypothetical protein